MEDQFQLHGPGGVGPAPSYHGHLATKVESCHPGEDEIQSMCKVLVKSTLVYESYFVIDACVQPQLAQEILELSDITSSSRTQQQQPLFILSLEMNNMVLVLDSDQHWIRGCYLLLQWSRVAVCPL